MGQAGVGWRWPTRCRRTLCFDKPHGYTHTGTQRKKTENNTNLPLSVCLRIWKIEEAHWLACSWVNTCSIVVAAVDHTTVTRSAFGYSTGTRHAASVSILKMAPRTLTEIAGTYRRGACPFCLICLLCREPRHTVHVTDVYATESRTPPVLELSADRFSVGLLLHCSPPTQGQSRGVGKGVWRPCTAVLSCERGKTTHLLSIQITTNSSSL